ncbi:hypothetical protein [Celerinatantimonas sp. YJH-8]|uniref:hypothetical protein n=1 Tax=Celerinatantimonas sp. YJH-8 TaxID=3228714 RepID=UPI0038C77209
MQKKFTIYDKSQLPKHFSYPEKYIIMSAEANLPEYFEWWFEDADTPAGKLAWNLRHSYKEWKNMKDKNLIPFAQLNDDAAFFDGNDTSGNPKVIVIDLGNTERNYEFCDFDSWFDFAKNG